MTIVPGPRAITEMNVQVHTLNVNFHISKCNGIIT